MKDPTAMGGLFVLVYIVIAVLFPLIVIVQLGRIWSWSRECHRQLAAINKRADNAQKMRQAATA